MQFNCFLGRSCRTLQVTFRRRFVDPGLQGRFQLKGIKVCTLEPVTLYVENFFLIVDSLYVASSCIEVGDCSWLVADHAFFLSSVQSQLCPLTSCSALPVRIACRRVHWCKYSRKKKQFDRKGLAEKMPFARAC